MSFWTGQLNDPHRFDADVRFYDTTLRDGEQTVGVVLSPGDKLELARGLDELGIERIEAGFPRVSKDDWRAVELIRDAGLNAEVWGFSRAVEADVKALVELGVGASVIESPISDLKLAALGVDREAMLERIVYAISFAVEQGVTVAFFGVDGTRADPGYFETVYKTAIDTNLRLDRARAFSERLRELSSYELEPFKPLVGDNLFRRESGAVASQFHDPPAIEPYSSELVAAERSIVLGKKSGIDSIRIKAEELGLELSDDAQRELLVRVKELGTKKRGLVTDDEFRELTRG